VHDAEGVLAGLAQALDVQRRPERSLEQSIVDVLRPRTSLLVVDNCEHVIATVGSLISGIVRWCRRASARHQPGAARDAGEQVWRVPPLAVPVDSGATWTSSWVTGGRALHGPRR
jgi:predicted ATPase